MVKKKIIYLFIVLKIECMVIIEYDNLKYNNCEVGHMNFIDRENEISTLEKEYKNSQSLWLYYMEEDV